MNKLMMTLAGLVCAGSVMAATPPAAPASPTHAAVEKPMDLKHKAKLTPAEKKLEHHTTSKSTK